jgi:hypothetical protein
MPRLQRLIRWHLWSFLCPFLEPWAGSTIILCPGGPLSLIRIIVVLGELIEATSLYKGRYQGAVLVICFPKSWLPCTLGKNLPAPPIFIYPVHHLFFAHIVVILMNLIKATSLCKGRYLGQHWSFGIILLRPPKVLTFLYTWLNLTKQPTFIYHCQITYQNCTY